MADENEINELKENFDFFDRDDNGEIDFGEFSELLRALGSDGPDEEYKAGFSAVDTDGNGTISFLEFSNWWLGDEG